NAMYGELIRKMIEESRVLSNCVGMEKGRKMSLLQHHPRHQRRQRNANMRNIALLCPDSLAMRNDALGNTTNSIRDFTILDAFKLTEKAWKMSQKRQ
ncbi:12989_t:CDS:1, partial [Dentiscutata erythropus]